MPPLIRRLALWCASREIMFAGFGVFAIGIVVLWVACGRWWAVDKCLDGGGRWDEAKGSCDRGTTLADPPPDLQTNPHAPNALVVPASAKRSAGANRLYEDGVDKTTPDNPAGGYWEFQECVAFYPEDVRCLKALGEAAYHQAKLNPRWSWSENADDARRAFEELLRLDPSTPDRERIAGLLQELEKRPPESFPSQAPPPGKARIVVVSRPSGATVHLDYQEMGVTPVEITNVSESHTHRVMISKKGYRHWEAPVTFKDNLVAIVDVALEEGEENAKISVMTIGVADCRVTVGNTKLGVAPFFKKVAPVGEHIVTVECPDGNTYSAKMTLAPGIDAKVVIKPGDWK